MATNIRNPEVSEGHRELEERIRRRAHEIYLSRGSEGSELDDWLQAEREILDKSRQPAQDRGTIVGAAAAKGREWAGRLGKS